MKYGLIGEKLGHSFSCEIHQKIALYEYELCPLPREELDGFMRKKDFLGINVTIPYKKDVIPYLDEISPEAALCGAVNTVIHKNGKLFGYNTDLSGMEYLLSANHISVKDKNVLILGTGGTSNTAMALCKKLGAKKIDRVSRTGKEGSLTYEEALRCKETQVILNTTPCGMFPNIGESPISVDGFPYLEGVADAVYNPLKSQLVLDAKVRKIPAVGGLEMLVAQAVEAAYLFTENQTVKDDISAVFREIVREKENLVLIGMPGCGKSTLGRLLAQETGKEFLDTDEEIQKEAGRTIPEIFAQEGESGFRDWESRVIARVAVRQNLVIATGGGAILRDRNVDLLKGNGVLLFLDAPLESLCATSDRPLSSTPEHLQRLFEQRYGRYCHVADRKIPISRQVEENLLAIKKELI